MRTARIKAEDSGYYHCISRIIELRQILGTREKEKLRRIMRKLEGFCGVQVLTYAILDSHLHILCRVPQRRELSDKELLVRLAFLYKPEKVQKVARQIEQFRKDGHDSAAETLKHRYTYRMYDLSEFMKTLKQRFSQYYNKRCDRCGPLWDQRFKSILVEGSEHALLTIAAYIDLNAVRAGIVSDPKSYRYCGYGEAMGGSLKAREGLDLIMKELGAGTSWSDLSRGYRRHLYYQGRAKCVGTTDNPVRSGFAKKKVEEVLASGGKLPMHVLLHCRVRYFTDGLVLGSREFVEETFAKYRDQFSLKRSSGARAMKHGDWKGLWTMRDLRLTPVSVS